MLADAELVVVALLAAQSKYQSLCNIDLCSKGIVRGMLTCSELLGNHKALLIVAAQIQ